MDIIDRVVVVADAAFKSVRRVVNKAPRDAEGVLDACAGVTPSFRILYDAVLSDIVAGDNVVASAQLAEIDTAILAVHRHPGTDDPVVAVYVLYQKLTVRSIHTGKTFIVVRVDQKISYLDVVECHEGSLNEYHRLVCGERYTTPVEDRSGPRSTAEERLVNSVVVAVDARAAVADDEREDRTWPCHSALENEPVPRRMGIRSSKTLHARRPFPRGRRRSS